MIKLRHLPHYFLAFLLLVLLVLEIWTWYLGTADVTFKRLVGSAPYPQIRDLSLRRYKESPISPHLFTITTKDEKSVLQRLGSDCNLGTIRFERLPDVVGEVDEEMVDVIQKSPYIYLSKTYDLQHPKEGRMCLVFRDQKHIYLFMNGNL